MIYDLPNPFMQVSEAVIPVSDREAAALEPDEPAPTCGGVAAEPEGYPCCHDCGVREPCDRHCPNFVEARFQLDPDALMAEIEPVPAFLTRGTSGVYDLREDDRDIRADQIEEMLELARAEDWPAPPTRMVG